jgi:hypothetical protein
VAVLLLEAVVQVFVQQLQAQEFSTLVVAVAVLQLVLVITLMALVALEAVVAVALAASVVKEWQG